MSMAAVELMDAVHEFMVDVGIHCDLPLPVPYNVPEEPKACDGENPLYHFAWLSATLQRHQERQRRRSPPPMLILEPNGEAVGREAEILATWVNERPFFVCPVMWRGGGMALLMFDGPSRTQWYYDPSHDADHYAAGVIVAAKPLVDGFRPRVVRTRQSPLQQAIEGNCRSLPHVRREMWRCGTACLLFAVVALRFGIGSNPERLADVLTAWFRGDPAASLVPPRVERRERCETAVRLLLWHRRVRHEAEEGRPLFEVLGLRLPPQAQAHYPHRWRPCAFALRPSAEGASLCRNAAIDGGPCAEHALLPEV